MAKESLQAAAYRKVNAELAKNPGESVAAMAKRLKVNPYEANEGGLCLRKK